MSQHMYIKLQDFVIFKYLIECVPQTIFCLNFAPNLALFKIVTFNKKRINQIYLTIFPLDNIMR